MLSNRFPDEGQAPEYTTVDATLWYFEAIRAYHAATGDMALLRDLFPVLQDIVDWHVRGTRYLVHVDPADGLLYAGEPGACPRAASGVQLSTPSACPAQDRPLRSGTPFGRLDGRQGFAVESSSPKGGRLGCHAAYPRLHGHQASGGQCPAKYPDCGEQYFAGDGVGLADWALRERAPFAPLRAGLRVYGDPALARSFLAPLIPWPTRPWPGREGRQELDAPCVGSVTVAKCGARSPRAQRRGKRCSEIFAGDPPHTPRGCIAQAWTVAEVLRVWKQLALAGV